MRPVRSPNWMLSGGYLVVFCQRCGRWLCRTSAITPGAELYIVCKTKGCGEVRFVIPLDLPLVEFELTG